MEPATPGSSRVRLGTFELDLRTGELRSLAVDSPAERVLLREQPFQILRMLVEHAGKIVTRAEIQKRLWPNDTVVDWDHSINVAVGILRRALGDSAAKPQYIETLARRGYRLIAPVEWLESRVPAGVPDVSVAPPPPSDLTGRTVSHYRVLEVLGGGGMGLVYEAEDLRLGRRAALKFLPQELAADPVALKRLEREAQTASALNHPNICTIYDIDDYEGQRFIAMELLEGETLEQRLASAADPLPPAELLDIAIQVCIGLEAAHGKDIVHRDIKPANLFLTRQGTVKVLDFGIAKQVTTEEFPEAATGVVEAGADVAGNAAPVGLTRTGATVGTSGYMSPEQVRREHLDGRSDLFSLGLVIYEMATGRRAFTGESALAVQDAILTTSPPAAETVNAAIPRALATILGRALEKDRSSRYQTAAGMRQDLEHARAALERSGKRRTRQWVPAAVALLVGAGVATTLWLASRGSGVTLGPNETIVLAHVDNATGDHVLSDALWTALRIALEQTPYVNVLADDKYRRALSALGVDQDAVVTPEIALDVCRRSGSKVVIAPAVAEAGNSLRVELRGIDCESGSGVIRVVENATSRDGIVAALGDAAVRLRQELGEPAASRSEYDATLERATSSSPDAIELLRLGYRRSLAGDMQNAIPFYERAAQTDPDFALAHAALSTAYHGAGDTAASIASARAALALRDRLTAPGRFQVESNYHLLVTGDLEQACPVLARWVESFPHDFIARTNLGQCLMQVGEPDRALGHLREAARLRPAIFSYLKWILSSLIADRIDEAEKTLNEARELGFETAELQDLRVRLAFHQKDEAMMERQWRSAEGKPEQHRLWVGKAMVEASRGRLRDALRTNEEAAALAIAADASQPSFYETNAAIMRAETGIGETGPIVVVAPDDGLSWRLRKALVLARTGHPEEAGQIAAALRRDFPTDTLVQKYGLPVIEGAAALASGDPAGAIVALEPATKYDLADTRYLEPLYPSYLRGLARLGTGEAALAAVEFQKMLDHPGLYGRGVLMPLARLQLARAQRAMGEDASALASYETFLELWKEADEDLPIYVAAKAEHRELRDRL